MDKSHEELLWVFMGEGATHPSAVFLSRNSAEEWIADAKVSGILTAYVAGESVYDWAIRTGRFSPKYPSQSEPRFIQRFSSAYAEHFHYKSGSRVT